VQPPDPQVTAQRPVQPPTPEVTVARPVQPPDPQVTAQRPVQPAGEAEPPPTAPPAQGGPNLKLLIPGGAAAVIVLVVLAVILLSSGSSTKKLASALHPQCAAHPPALINDGFPEPPMIFSRGGVLDMTLKATTTTTTVDGKRWPAMAYNGSIPAPTLVICPGDLVSVALKNGLPLETNLHVHGLHVSSEGDGDNVFVDIHPFEDHTYRYQIPLDQSPGSFWYHPHYHPVVQPEVESGLAGAILVQGGLDDRLASIPERLMVIQGGREVLGPPIPLPPAIAKRLKPPPLAGPPVFIVNGVHNPTLKIRPGEIQRWRLVNASSDRELRISMPHTTFQLLAVDGNTLHTMLPRTQLLLAPGSRMEVLVKGAASGSYPLVSEAFQKCYVHCLDPFAGEGQNGIPDPQETLLTVNSSGAAAQDTLPSGVLANPEDLATSQVAVHRTLEFARTQDLNVGKLTFPLNHELFSPNRVDVTMKLGSVEEWTLVNPITPTHNEWHTFHIHQNPFQVISINGHRLNYVDYEDNVDLPPGSKVVIRMKPIDFVGKFVFHCHLIFHEDNGMMGVVQVLANPTAAQQQAHTIMYMTPPNGHQLLASVNAAQTQLTGSERAAYLLYCRQHGITPT
jgi:FtsP/CotA-like multicopper oxidase with cupredoxin domain